MRPRASCKRRLYGRSEDLKQVRDLHLVRDERDREVEAEAGRRAGNAVLLVTQLLAAACLLQGDPAWMALLSLTFIWGAVKGFCRFGQDREKLYLAWGLLTAAGAAILLGAYFRQAWSAGMSLSRLVGYAVLCRVLVMIAGLLWAGLLLGIFWLAHRIGHMEGDRWDVFPVRLHRRTAAADGRRDGGGPGGGGGHQRPAVRPAGLPAAGAFGGAVFRGGRRPSAGQVQPPAG